MRGDPRGIRIVTMSLPPILAAEPKTLWISGASEDFKLEAAESGDKPKRFSITGYTGGMMRLEGWPYPVVVDLEGLSILRQDIPALYGHDRERIVGQTSEISKTAQRLKLTGSLRADAGAGNSPGAIAAGEIIGLGKGGFAWQASIGASPDQYKYVPAGESFKANGRNFDGPAYHVQKSTLAEISFVPIGADMNTSANVAAAAAQAAKEAHMNPEFKKWLEASGLLIDSLTAEQKAALEKTWQQATSVTASEARFAKIEAAIEKIAAGTPAPIAAGGGTGGAPGSTGSGDFNAKMAAIEAESQRVQYIQERTMQACTQHVANPAKIAELKELCASAVADTKIDAKAFDLALLRADRMMGPNIITNPTEQQMNEEVIVAAICQTAKLPGAEKQFKEQTLEAAHRHFRRGISLRDVLIVAAQRNANYRGSSRDDHALCRAAFDIRASGGPSSIAVPGILSNVANKFLASGFLYTEQSYRAISKIRTANDFKQMSTYRLTGANKFKKVAPGGEIKHGTLSELTYTNQVDTYGIMIGLDRRDIRNDDLGAFTSVPQELGRGAGDSLNEIFWTEYLDDSTFYPTDKSYNNYDDGATDSVLSLAGLDNADQIFALQTKPDGTPMGIQPAILLVPRALRNTARNLMAPAPTASAQSTATVTIQNVWAGQFMIVDSVYLQSSAISGYSATAWYLLADPNNVPTIEIAFLDGIETPVVESSQFDFDRLGMSMRAYMDWGCNKQEYRGGVKLKGAA